MDIENQLTLQVNAINRIRQQLVNIFHFLKIVINSFMTVVSVLYKPVS